MIRNFAATYEEAAKHGLTKHEGVKEIVGVLASISKNGCPKPPFSREVLDLMREMDLAYRAGKPIQEIKALRFYLEMARSMGATFPTNATSVPDFIRACPQAIQLGFLSAMRTRSVADLDSFTPHAYIADRSIALGQPNIFRIGPDLLDALVNTDLSGALSSDVRFPFGGFYIALPGNTRLRCSDGTNSAHRFAVSLIGVAETGELGPRGRSMVTVAYAEPRAGSIPDDDAISTRFTSLDSEEDARLTEAFKSMGAFKSDGMEWDGYPDYNITPRLVLNFILYLSTRPRIRAAGSGKEVSLDQVAQFSPPRRTRVDMRLRPQRWDVGGGTSIIRRKPTDVVVRGHWRNQAHGPKHALRRLTWIEPHVRCATGADAPGHDYVWSA
ncbi:MAG TPA: hypothetical protein VM686_19010 [Polyangiaceae bacterium]|nr:hypothetical protein [Polyangiaceae bacterium]